jgi:hypothetical protein
MSYPSGTTWVEYTILRNIEVDIVLSENDSCLNFYIVRSDTSFREYRDVKIPYDLNHESQWGGGSSYGSLEVKLFSDSIYIFNFQKCGIPCTSSETFFISR